MERTTEEIAMFDELDEVLRAYTALEIITVDGNGDLIHASQVLCILNYRLKAILEKFEAAYIAGHLHFPLPLEERKAA